MSQERRQFLELLDSLRPSLARAFEEAVLDVRSSAQLTALEDAISKRDVERAFEVLRLNAAFWAPLDRKIDEVFYAGGVHALSKLPPKSLQNTGLAAVRFQGRHPRAEAWVKQATGDLIREIVTDQRDMVRDVVRRGLETGRGPRSLALDIVGRMEGNARKGGFIGLTRNQAGWVENARRQLEDLDAGYFQRELRDRRFDSLVKRAIREDKPLSKADVQRITGRYSDRLLKMRGNTVARTEAMRALNAGRQEGIRQLIDTGKVPASAVELVWEATPSGRTRETHSSMNGQRIKFGGLFQSPSGALMEHPGDTSHGAPAEELINCRCTARTVVDWAALAR